MNTKKIAASIAPALLLLGIAAFAFAQTPPGLQTPGAVADLPALLLKIDTIVNLVFTALVVFAIIYIILAAFQFVTAGGDPNGVLQARSKLIYAAVGIIVALLAKSIPTVLKAVLGL